MDGSDVDYVDASGNTDGSGSSLGDVFVKVRIASPVGRYTGNMGVDNTDYLQLNVKAFNGDTIEGSENVFYATGSSSNWMFTEGTLWDGSFGQSASNVFLYKTQNLNDLRTEYTFKTSIPYGNKLQFELTCFNNSDAEHFAIADLRVFASRGKVLPPPPPLELLFHEDFRPSTWEKNVGEYGFQIRGRSTGVGFTTLKFRDSRDYFHRRGSDDFIGIVHENYLFDFGDSTAFPGRRMMFAFNSSHRDDYIGLAIGQPVRFPSHIVMEDSDNSPNNTNETPQYLRWEIDYGTSNLAFIEIDIGCLGTSLDSGGEYVYLRLHGDAWGSAGSGTQLFWFREVGSRMGIQNIRKISTR
jgi:hypothetical protein